MMQIIFMRERERERERGFDCDDDGWDETGDSIG